MIFTRFEHRFVRISAVFPLIRAGHRQIADPHTFQQLYSIASASVLLVDSPRFRGFPMGFQWDGDLKQPINQIWRIQPGTQVMEFTKMVI